MLENSTSISDNLMNQNQACLYYLNAFLMVIPNMVMKLKNIERKKMKICEVLDPLSSAHACHVGKVLTQVVWYKSVLLIETRHLTLSTGQA